MKVYVLTEYGRPAAVLSSEQGAEAFYQEDPSNRDYFPFDVDRSPIEHPAAPGSVAEQTDRIFDRLNSIESQIKKIGRELSKQ